MSKLASLLGGMTLNDLAKEVLSLQGRKGDTELAHVNKREAALLKAHGGSGDVNPSTGMTEFYDGMDYGGYDVDPFGGFPAADTSAPFQEQYGELAFAQPEQAAPFQEQYGELAFAGQPTPQFGGAPSVSPPQEISGFQGAYPQAAELPTFAGTETFAPDYSRFTGAYPEIGAVAQEAAPPAPAAPGLSDRLEQLSKELQRKEPLVRLLGAGAAGLGGALTARKGARQARAIEQEMKGLAAPYRQLGQELIGAGQRGELTAAQQQQVAALQAREKQDLARRGVTSGTAAQQSEIRVQEFAQRLAQQNIDRGIQLTGIADKITQDAIRAGYAADANAQANAQRYFAAIAPFLIGEQKKPA